MLRRLGYGDRTMIIAIYILLAILAFVTFYPFWNSLVISFNEGKDTSMGGVTFWPRVWTWDNYETVFKDDRLLDAFNISVLRTVIGTFFSIFATALFAYGMTKKELIGRNAYMVVCIITLYFSGGLIPTFLLIQELHLMNKFAVFILPVLISVWNMIIFRTFFNGLPEGLQESAKIDGCGHWGTFFRIVLPLSGPVLATLGLFTAVFHWNEWFIATIYINNPDLMPIQTLLRQILNSNVATENLSNLDGQAAMHIARFRTITSKSLSMAIMMVSTLPIVLVYPFIQRFFVKGVLIGSLKE